MKINILGCGSSSGVPEIGCGCRVCQCGKSKNCRTRSSILVEEDDTAILIDTTPDFRQQALNNNIKKIDAILYTHSHADHISGIDEIRSFNKLMKTSIPAYGTKETMDYLSQAFSYVFKERELDPYWSSPHLIKNIIDEYDRFHIKRVEIRTFKQLHNKMPVLGIRVGDFAYSTDVSYLPEESLAILQGIKVWVVECLQYESTPAHAGLDTVLKWAEKIKPGRLVLTHMNHSLDYDDLVDKLPRYIEPAYDGMIIKC